MAATAGFLGVSALGGSALVLYLGAAVIFAYVGFWQRDATVTRAVVGGLGALYLISGVILALFFVALEFPFEGRSYVETFGLVAFGSMSALCSQVLPFEDGPPEQSR